MTFSTGYQNSTPNQDSLFSQKPSILKVVDKDLCTGCGTCMGICPKKAVIIKKNDLKGVYIPSINQEKCNHCGLCYEVCPGHSVDFNNLNQSVFGHLPSDIMLGNYLNCYLGYATEYKIRYNSASGGLVTALLIYALEKGFIDGALVTRMRKGYPLEPESFIAYTRDEIISAAKSKYCPVPANIAIRKILEGKGKFAVVGLPCHIHGIRKAEAHNKRLKEKIVFHFGLFCSMGRSFLATENLLRMLGIPKSDIVALNYRGEGWPGKMTIILKNGQHLFIPLSEYYKYFGPFTPYRCTLCSDQTAELADLSFGDAWLPELRKKEKSGMSIVISRNKSAQYLLKQAVSDRKIELMDFNSKKAIDVIGCGFKKKQLAGRLLVSRLLGKKLPVFNQKFPKSDFGDLVAAIKFYLLRSFTQVNWIRNLYYFLRPKYHGIHVERTKGF